MTIYPTNKYSNMFFLIWKYLIFYYTSHFLPPSTVLTPNPSPKQMEAQKLLE